MSDTTNNAAGMQSGSFFSKCSGMTTVCQLQSKYILKASFLFSSNILFPVVWLLHRILLVLASPFVGGGTLALCQRPCTPQGPCATAVIAATDDGSINTNQFCFRG